MSIDEFPTTLLNKETEVNTRDAFSGLDAIGIYFSAHWCPPCKKFTPILGEKYAKLKEAGKKVEIVFASSDRNQEAFNDYYKEMPFLALKYEDRDVKNRLAKRYKCEGIPYLVFVNPNTWETITTNGRGEISSESYIENFPYLPRPMYDLSESMEGLMEEIAFVCFNDYAEKEIQDANKEVIMEFAKAHKAEGGFVKAWFTANGKSGIEKQMRPSFELGSISKKHECELSKVNPEKDNVGPYCQGSCCDECRKFMPATETSYRCMDCQYDNCLGCYEKMQNLPQDIGEIKKPQMTLLDFPNRKFWFPSKGKDEITKENIQFLLDEYNNKTLEERVLKI